MATSTAKPAVSAKSVARAKPAAKKAAAAKSAATKPAPPRITAPKVAAPALPDRPAAPAVVDAGAEKALVPQLRKKDLVARVVAALDGKKKGTVKDIVEATLAALGEALQKGEALNLPPFGKARIAKQKGEGKASSMTVKLRGAGAKNAPKAAKQALAEAGEDD